MKNTKGADYTSYLKSKPLWKKVFDVQAPYRYKLRSLKPGYTLDIGCGTGRNLENLCVGKTVQGNTAQICVGIDHNPHSIEVCRQKGFETYTTAEFNCKFDEKYLSEGAPLFETLLFSHLLEHMSFENACELLGRYLPLLKPGGQVIVTTPQEAGYKSDPTHVNFVDFDVMAKLFDNVGIQQVSKCSFPFPRFFGPVFVYNEFWSVGVKRC